MAERHSLYIIVCLFALHCFVSGFEVEGEDGIKRHQLSNDKPCVSILATDMEMYEGKLLNLQTYHFHWISFLRTFQTLEHLP